MGDPVFVRNYRSCVKWLPGEIQEKTSPVSFKVKLTDDWIVHRLSAHVFYSSILRLRSNVALKSGPDVRSSGALAAVAARASIIH